MGCGPTCPPAASTATGAATATASAAPALCSTGRCRPSSNAFPAHADSHTSSEGEGGRRSRTPSAEAEGFPKDGPTGTDFVPTDTAVNSGGGACVLAAAPAPAPAAAAPTTAPAIIAAAFAKGLTEAARSTCCCSSSRGSKAGAVRIWGLLLHSVGAGGSGYGDCYATVLFPALGCILDLAPG